jgi:hypothetical protein
MAELDAMEPRFSQWLPGAEVPETHWMYKLAKRYWFNDFAAYRGCIITTRKGARTPRRDARELA